MPIQATPAPPRSTVVTVAFRDREVLALDHAAKLAGVTRSEAVRESVADWIRRQKALVESEQSGSNR